jgi:death-on-curing family protein
VSARKAVRELAAAAQIDVDEALVSLWDAGIEYVTAAGSLILPRDAARAQRAVGLATRKDLLSMDYWQRTLGLTAEDYAELLAELDIRVRPGGTTLPKGAVAKLKKQRPRGLLSALPALPVAAAPVALPPLEWRSIGHERELRHLTAGEVVKIHFALVDDFARHEDPIEPAGVRSEHLLESAIFRSRTSLGEHSKYPTVEMAGAALLQAVVHDHPFHNGNKRTGVVSLLVFLDENGHTLNCDEDELFRFVLQLAQHNLVPKSADTRDDREALAVAEWIRVNSRSVEKGEFPLKWVRLKKILNEFDCWWEPVTGVGNRINLHRRVRSRTKRGREKSLLLSTQVHYAGDGREVQRNTVGHIRRRLELDDEHGVDSRSFYRMDGSHVDEFIATYRKTLNRLARL